MNQELNAIYRDIIREHHQDPRNYGEVTTPTCVQEGFNPLCGDRVVLTLKLSPEKDRLEDLRFTGEGCSICLASTSIMSEEVRGQPVSKVRSAIQKFRDLMQGKEPPENFEGDIEALSGVRQFPVRIKCALLGWTTLQEALEKVKAV